LEENEFERQCTRSQLDEICRVTKIDDENCSLFAVAKPRKALVTRNGSCAEENSAQRPAVLAVSHQKRGRERREGMLPKAPDCA
jgi:hypothetical protein